MDHKIIECKNCHNKQPYPMGASKIAWCAVKHLSKFLKILPGDACDVWEKNGGHDKYSMIYEESNHYK